MKTMATLTMTGLLLAGLAVGTRAEDPGKSPAGTPAAATPSTRTVENLVRDLGADSADAREAATQALVARGGEAIPALEKAREDPDPEVAWRARRAIEEIRGAAEVRPPKRREGEGEPSSSVSVHIGGDGGSFSMSRDASGRVSVTATEMADGKPVTRTYSAATVEEFRKQYPEIAEKYGVTENGFGLGGMKFGFQGGSGGFGIDDEWMKDFAERLQGPMGGWQEEMRRQMEEMQKMLKDMQQGAGVRRHRNDPGESPDEVVEAPEPPVSASPASPARFGATVSVLEPALRYQLDLSGEEGLLVDSLESGSPAAEAGLRKYDVILKIDDEPVTSAFAFRRQWRTASANPVVEVTVLRAGERQVLRVNLRPEGK